MENIKELEQIKELCKNLNSENKNYVLAVANALKFAQTEDSTKTAS